MTSRQHITGFPHFFSLPPTYQTPSYLRTFARTAPWPDIHSSRLPALFQIFPFSVSPSLTALSGCTALPTPHTKAPLAWFVLLHTKAPLAWFFLLHDAYHLLRHRNWYLFIHSFTALLKQKCKLRTEAFYLLCSLLYQQYFNTWQSRPSKYL